MLYWIKTLTQPYKCTTAAVMKHRLKDFHYTVLRDVKMICRMNCMKGGP